jgi:hypothetical protein
MKVRPIVWPYTGFGGSGAYVGIQDWWACPSCWHWFNIDRGHIVASVYPPDHCPQCKIEWDKPVRLVELSHIVGDCVIVTRAYENYPPMAMLLCRSCWHYIDEPTSRGFESYHNCPSCEMEWNKSIRLEDLISAVG